MFWYILLGAILAFAALKWKLFKFIVVSYYMFVVSLLITLFVEYTFNKDAHVNLSSLFINN
jgi:hypothetical protein